MIRAQHLPRIVAGLLVVGFAGVAEAQLANASTAATEGYNAVYWNPANLGMPGNQGFSFTLLPVDGQAGLKPIDLQRLKDYEGAPVPKSVREEWMLDVEANGVQKGALGGGVTELAFSLGPIAFQASTKLAGDMDLSPGAVEALPAR